MYKNQCPLQTNLKNSMYVSTYITTDIEKWSSRISKGIAIKKPRGHFGLGKVHEVVVNGAGKGVLHMKMLSCHQTHQVSYLRVKASVQREKRKAQGEREQMADTGEREQIGAIGQRKRRKATAQREQMEARGQRKQRRATS